MANFNTHINSAAIVSGVLATTLGVLHFADFKTSFYCFIAGVVGGILPDIDHSNSIPIKILQFVLTNLVAFLLVVKYFDNLDLLEIVGIWLGSYILFEFLFFLFKKFTTHRGIIHSIPVGFLFGIITSLFFMKVLHFPIINSYFIGSFLFLGYMVHLILDEIYSVDLLGRRLKKSFGSAFKFFSGNKLLDLLIYVLIISIIFLLPKKELFFKTIKGFFNV